MHLDTDFKGKKVLVVGAGISGFAAAKYLAAAGARVTLSDAKDEADAEKDALTQKHIEDLRAQGISCVFGAQGEEQLAGVDLLVLSPAVPDRIPLVRSARTRGISSRRSWNLSSMPCSLSWFARFESMPPGIWKSMTFGLTSK